MAGVNRLEKFFEDAANCHDCGHDIDAVKARLFEELKSAVGLLIGICRKREMDDKQMSHVFAVAILKSANGGK